MTLRKKNEEVKEGAKDGGMHWMEGVGRYKKIILTIKVNWERYMRVRDAWQQHYFCFARLLFVFGKIGLRMSLGGLAFHVLMALIDLIVMVMASCADLMVLYIFSGVKLTLLKGTATFQRFIKFH